MIFPDDMRLDIKTFWGIPLGKLLKVLVPLGLALACYILWFPFPDIPWRIGLSVVIFVAVSGSIALNIPRFFGIYKRYRQRPKLIQSQPDENAGNELTCLQDLIRVDRLNDCMDKVLIEWDNGWISLLCQVSSDPIDYESSATIALIQKGLKDALAVASANSLRLNWIEDADREYDEDVWADRREQALRNVLPGGRELTQNRMDEYEALAKHAAITSRLLLRIDASITHLMREENGATDFERKEQALTTFSHTAGTFINNMSSAKLHLTPMGEEDLAWIIQQEVAPWTRGKKVNSQILAEELFDADEKNSDDKEPPTFEEDLLIDHLKMTSDKQINDYDDLCVIQDLNKDQSLEQRTPLTLTSHSPSVPFTLQTKNPFVKKTVNPFAKKTSGDCLSPDKAQQKVLPFIKPIKLPKNVVVVFSTKRYVGVTTVSVNLTPPQGLLINLGRGEQPMKWPEHFMTLSVSGERRVTEIVSMAERFDRVTVDLGLYTEDCLDVIKAAQNVVYVTDNQQNTLGVSLQQTENLPRDKMMLAINKAIPSGLSPGLLSAQLGMLIGIMIPFDSYYSDGFGLSLPSKPWELFRQLIIEREVSVL
ncbi:hypothetical protein [Desulfosporosinus shakirovi]|uniref:hypothetical protein n=1 Tax=Desulfosporosinus shakirovi TaxID=2885154 RepID=UPI001E523119|nr:hypothetical protein [Desulfosporosinus sp. SRJS8]MCB8818616.1 hypothetical protein [Desulfosporosinus sp. SRJS8]